MLYVYKLKSIMIITSANQSLHESKRLLEEDITEFDIDVEPKVDALQPPCVSPKKDKEEKGIGFLILPTSKSYS